MRRHALEAACSIAGGSSQSCIIHHAVTQVHISKANGAPFSAFYVCFQAKTLQLYEMLLRRMMITIVFPFGYPHLQPASMSPLLQTGNGNSRQMETFLLSYE